MTLETPSPTLALALTPRYRDPTATPIPPCRNLALTLTPLYRDHTLAPTPRHRDPTPTPTPPYREQDHPKRVVEVEPVQYLSTTSPDCCRRRLHLEKPPAPAAAEEAEASGGGLNFRSGSVLSRLPSLLPAPVVLRQGLQLFFRFGVPERGGGR